MKTKEKFDYLELELIQQVEKFRIKRQIDKLLAFSLKILAILIAASITVLLGLKVAKNLSDQFVNISLALSALISVINGMDAFFDFRSLWIQKTLTLSRLRELKRDLMLYKTGLEENELELDVINKFNTRYNRIFREDLKSWLKMREEQEDVSTQEANNGLKTK